MRVLFTGGGTGGHFFPIIAVARELRRVAEEEQIIDLEFYYAGPDDFGEKDLEKEDIYPMRIISGKRRRYASWQNVFDALKIGIGILQAFWKLFIVLPDVIFSKGGYGSVPVLFAARIYRIPVIIHESDAVPGAVNAWSAKFAKRIAVSFAASAKYFPDRKIAFTGNPIRKKLIGGDKKNAKENLGIVSDTLPVVFFIGGSQGAQKINEALIEKLPEYVARYEILHQTGKNNFEDVTLQAHSVLENIENKDRYHPIAFFSEQVLHDGYAACDLVVARSGAGMIFEIASIGKPSILIPLKNSAQNHQRENAYAYAKSGGALVIEEDNLTPYLLLTEVNALLQNKKALADMAQAAGKFARFDAAEVIAREIIKIGLH